MKDERKTKQELVDELAELRHRLATLESPGNGHEPADKAHGEREEQAYRALVEQANEGICIIQDDVIKYANPRLAETWGGSVEELIGAHITDFISIDKVSKIVELSKRRMAGEDIVPKLEESLPLKNGGEIDAELRVSTTIYEGRPAYVVFLRDVSERKRAEVALRESEERYRTLVEQANDGICTIWDGKFAYVNTRLAEMGGYAVEELIDTPFTQYVPSDALPKLLDYYRRRIAGEDLPQTHEVVLERRNGERRDVELNASVITYQGKPADLVVVRDITERKEIERQLQESEVRLKTITDSAQDAIMMMDSRDRVSFWNPAAERIFGYKPEEVLGKNLHSFLAPERYHEAHRQALAEFAQTGQGGPIGKTLEVYAGRKDGVEIPIELSLSSVRVDGSWHAVAIVRDITERKQAEEALRQSEEHFRGFFEHAAIGMAMWTLEGRIFRVNRSFCDMLGYTEEEMLGKKGREIMHPDDWEIERKELKELLEGNVDSIHGARRHIHKQGHAVWGFSSASLVRDVSGNPSHIIAQIQDVTERKRAEEALRESEEFQRILLQHFPYPIAVYNPDTSIRFVNPAFEELTGFSASEVLGQKAPFPWWPEEAADGLKGFKEMMREGANRHELFFKKKNGELFWVETTAIPAWLEGEYKYLVTNWVDITDRRQAEEKLRKSEAQLSNAVQIAHLGPWEYDAVNDIFTFNDAFYAMFRTTAEEVGGYTMSSEEYARRFVHPEDAHLVGEESRKSLETADPNFSSQIDHRIIYADGQVGYISVRIFIVKDEAGRTIRTFGVNQDITERRRMEEALRESEEKHRMLAESSLTGIFIIQDGRYVFVNRRFAEMHGYEPEELIGMDNLKLIHPDDREAVRHNIERRVKGEIPSEQYELRAWTKDGRPFWIETMATAIEYNGRPADMGNLIDISERKRMEAALRESEEKFRTLTQELNVGVFRRAPGLEGGLIEANPAYAHLYGYESEEELHDVPLPDLFENPKDAREYIEQLMNEGSVKGKEERLKKKDGTPFWGRITAVLIRDESGNPKYYQGVVEDVTEWKRAEEKLKNTMEELKRSNQELEQFAYVASHDLQEPLRMVSSYMHLIEKRYNDKLDADGQEFMHYAVDGSKRMQRLINDLLAYSRVGTRGKPFQPTDCDAVLRSVVVMLEMAIRDASAEVTWDNMPQIVADEGQLVQLFQNLVANAVKFRGDETPRVHISAKERHDDWLFSVQDNGKGIDSEFKERVFRIFQRLHRGEYEGTGIGLAVCKKIVERHGGQIWLESEPGQGTTFRFTVPK
ncbi:MAG: PAS domain S-box protein [Dehalococcoidia bacterium]